MEQQPVEMKTAYSPLVTCYNCGLSEIIEIQYGKLIVHTECPNCRCKELHLIRNKK